MPPVFVDFDSTLTMGTGSPWWEDALQEEPRRSMIGLVNGLYKNGHTIIIYTARQEKVREETEYYLNKWGVFYHALRMEKPGYSFLIDDRAVSDGKAIELGVDGIEERIQSW